MTLKSPFPEPLESAMKAPLKKRGQMRRGGEGEAYTLTLAPHSLIGALLSLI
jgi:hypothetical protein